MKVCDRLQAALLGILLLFGVSGMPALADSGSLAAAFSFDGLGGLLNDSSGNQNTGTLGPMVVPTSGKYAGGLVFNGANYVTINDSDSLDLTTGLTLEAWVNPSVPIRYWSTVVLKEQPDFLVYGLFAGSPGGRPAFYISSPFLVGVEGSNALPVKTWSHLAATYDGVTLRLYVNGVEVGNTVSIGSIVTSSEPLRMGGNAIWSEYFTGVLDEVRVYGRALTAGEISMDLGTPISRSTTGPPIIAAQPQSQRVAFGQSAVFSVVAGGAPPLSYQWYFNVTTPINGATDSQLIVPNASDSVEGNYAVRISNSDGSIFSQNAYLTVNHPPTPISPVLSRYAGGGFAVRDTVLLGSDPDGDVVTLHSLDSVSQQGGLVTASAGWVTYVPPAGLQTDDRFNFTIVDHHGAIATDVATITILSAQGPALAPPLINGIGPTYLTGVGIPHSGYVIEAAEDLLQPIWERIGFVETDATGIFGFLDFDASDSDRRFYRVTNPGGGSGRTYSTEFSLNENPISESGNWINGQSAGLDWANVATTNGVAIGLQSGLAGFDDGTALLGGNWGPDQFVTARVYIGQRPPPGILGEVEFRLRSSLSPHHCDGYEVLFSVKGGSDCYISVVSWNGPLGDWTALDIRGGAQYVINDGDEVKASIVGNVITAYIRGEKVVEVTDDRFTFGSPGIGFYLYGGTGGNADFGLTSFTATDVAPR